MIVAPEPYEFQGPPTALIINPTLLVTRFLGPRGGLQEGL